MSSSVYWRNEQDIYRLGLRFGSIIHAVEDDEAHKYSYSHEGDLLNNHPDDIRYYVVGKNLKKGEYTEETMFNNNRIIRSVNDSVSYFRKTFRI